MDKLRFETVHQFKLLGIKFDNKLDPAIMQGNYTKQFNGIKRDLFSWSEVHLLQLEKAQIVKTYTLSKIHHIAVTVPTPDNKAIHSIEASIVRFMNRYLYFRSNKDLTFRDRNMGVSEFPNSRHTLKPFNLAG